MRPERRVKGLNSEKKNRGKGNFKKVKEEGETKRGIDPIKNIKQGTKKGGREILKIKH